MTKIVLHHAPDLCTLKVFSVSPKCELSIFNGLIIKQKIKFVYILKMESVRAFMNGNKRLKLGLCLVTAQSLMPVTMPKTGH